MILFYLHDFSFIDWSRIAPPYSPWSFALRPETIVCACACVQKYQQSVCQQRQCGRERDGVWGEGLGSLFSVTSVGVGYHPGPPLSSLLGYQFRPSIMERPSVKGQAWPSLPRVCVWGEARERHTLTHPWSLTLLTFPCSPSLLLSVPCALASLSPARSFPLSPSQVIVPSPPLLSQLRMAKWAAVKEGWSSEGFAWFWDSSHNTGRHRDLFTKPMLVLLHKLVK